MTEKESFLGFMKYIWPVWAVGALVIMAMSLPYYLSRDDRARVVEAAGDPAFQQGMAKAGYRFAPNNDRISARCDRRDERGPLACDAPPSRPGLRIAIQEF